MFIYSQWKSFTGPFYSRSNDGRYSTAIVMGDMSHFGEVWLHWPLLAVTSYNSLGLFLYFTTKEEPSQASRLCPDPFQGIIFPPSTRNLARSHKEWGSWRGRGWNSLYVQLNNERRKGPVIYGEILGLHSTVY